MSSPAMLMMMVTSTMIIVVLSATLVKSSQKWKSCTGLSAPQRSHRSWLYGYCLLQYGHEIIFGCFFRSAFRASPWFLVIHAKHTFCPSVSSTYSACSTSSPHESQWVMVLSVFLLLLNISFSFLLLRCQRLLNDAFFICCYHAVIPSEP